MKKLLFVLLMLLFVSVVAVAIPRILRINQVVCESQFGPCSYFISEKLQRIRGKSLHDAKVTAKDILSSELFAVSFTSHFNLPDKLIINIIERKAVVSISYDVSRWWLVDKDGIVIGESEVTNLPSLQIEDTKADFGLGARTPDRIYFAQNLLERLNYSYQVTFGRVTADALVVQLPSLKEVIFPLEGDQEILMGSLSLLLSRLKTADQYSIIDLRYKNPVLK